MNDFEHIYVSKHEFFETEKHKDFRDLLLRYLPQAIHYEESEPKTIVVDRETMIDYSSEWLRNTRFDLILHEANTKHGIKAFETYFCYLYTERLSDRLSLMLHLREVVDGDGMIIFSKTEQSERKHYREEVCGFLKSHLLQKKLEKSFKLPNIHSTPSPRPRL